MKKAIQTIATLSIKCNMNATEAKNLADQVNAANPEKAMREVLIMIKSASKKGLYSDLALLRTPDVKAILPILTVLGYKTDLKVAESREMRQVWISWD
jgi:hypothetical protein